MIVGMDLETTGLNFRTCQILEMAVLILDDNLEVLDEAQWVIHTSEDILNNMNEFCTDAHTKSGLVDQCLKSNIDLFQCREELLSLFRKHGIDTPDINPPLFGNTIGFDRQFLTKYFREISKMLSYRNIDVSSIKECVKRWKPDVQFEKGETPHRAMEDLHLSLKEAIYYKDLFFS